MQPPGRLEDSLRLAEFVGKRGQKICIDLWPGCHCAAANLERLQACLAANTTGARGVKMPFQGDEVRQRVAAELHVHDVVLLIGINLGIETVGDPGELIARLKDTFSEQEATGQFEVGTRRAHRHGHGLLLASRQQADLQRLLCREVIGALLRPPLLYNLDIHRSLRRGTLVAVPAVQIRHVLSPARHAARRAEVSRSSAVQTCTPLLYKIVILARRDDPRTETG